MIILSQSIRTTKNYVTWILTVFLFISRLEIFMEIPQMMSKKYLIHQIMKFYRSLPKEKNKKVIGLMKDELGGKITTLLDL